MAEDRENGKKLAGNAQKRAGGKTRSESDTFTDMVLQADTYAREKRAKRKYSSWKKWVQNFIQFFVIFVILLTLLFRYVVGVAKIDGKSMDPTYRDGQTVWYSRLDRTYARGDVVCFRLPTGELLVKRIIAVGGDTVDLSDGAVLINGEKIDESSYAHGVTQPEAGEVVYPYKIPEGSYFVMGDNRENSVDSRSFKAIVGEAVCGKLP